MKQPSSRYLTGRWTQDHGLKRTSQDAGTSGSLNSSDLKLKEYDIPVLPLLQWSTPLHLNSKKIHLWSVSNTLHVYHTSESAMIQLHKREAGFILDPNPALLPLGHICPRRQTQRDKIPVDTEVTGSQHHAQGQSWRGKNTGGTAGRAWLGPQAPLQFSHSCSSARYKLFGFSGNESGFDQESDKKVNNEKCQWHFGSKGSFHCSWKRSDSCLAAPPRAAWNRHGFQEGDGANTKFNSANWIFVHATD